MKTEKDIGAELVGQALRWGVERLRRNRFGCYGAAEYKRHFSPSKWCHECLDSCEHYESCKDVDRSPTGCAVVVFEKND